MVRFKAMQATLNRVVSTIRLPFVNVGDFSVTHIALNHLVLQLLLIWIDYRKHQDKSRLDKYLIDN